MTIPNLITTLRFILTPIFIIYLLNDKLLSALIVFIIAGLSDGIDGFLARALNQKTNIGAYLDPLADKILLISAFIVLPVKGLVPSWLAVIVISRDILILSGVSILFLIKEELTIKPSILSKITTCFQLLTVFIVLSRPYFHSFLQFNIYLFWITAFVTTSSGLHYIYNWFQMIGEES